MLIVKRLEKFSDVVERCPRGISKAASIREYGVVITTNCIVTRKLRDYSTRLNHQKALYMVPKRVSSLIVRQKEKNTKKRERRRKKERERLQLLFILSDCKLREALELKLLASLNFHCSVSFAALPFRRLDWNVSPLSFSLSLSYTLAWKKKKPIWSEGKHFETLKAWLVLQARPSFSKRG